MSTIDFSHCFECGHKQPQMNGNIARKKCGARMYFIPDTSESSMEKSDFMKAIDEANKLPVELDNLTYSIRDLIRRLTCESNDPGLETAIYSIPQYIDGGGRLIVGERYPLDKIKNPVATEMEDDV